MPAGETRHRPIGPAVAVLIVVIVCFGLEAVGLINAGTFGIVRRDASPSTQIVAAVSLPHAGSPELRVGDVIRVDRLTLRQRVVWMFPRARDVVDLQVERRGKPLTVRLAAHPLSAQQRAGMVVRGLPIAAFSLLYALLAVLIAAKAPRSVAVRPILAFVLGLAAVGALTQGGTVLAPSAGAAAALYVLAQLAVVAILYGQLAFPLIFPPRRTRARSVLACAGAGVGIVYAAAYELVSVGNVLGVPQSFALAQSYSALGLTFEVLCACAVVESIRSGGRASRAQTMSAGSTLLLLALYYALVDCGALLQWDVSWALAVGVGAVPFAAGLGMAYAVLRHRLVELQLAISRAAIFSAVSLVLLSAFLLAEWAIALIFEHAVGAHFAEGSKTLAAAAIALVVGLSARTVHDVVAHRLNRLFFARRFRALEELHRFALETDAATDAAALVELTASVLDRHLDASYLALYARDAHGRYVPLRSAGSVDCTALDENDEIVLRLRRWSEAFVNDRDLPAFPGAFVCPMTLRGMLHGFLVCGPKRDRTAYLPDEREMLVTLTHRVGVAYEWLTRGGAARSQPAVLERLPSF